jgi:hypothetical protein
VRPLTYALKAEVVFAMLVTLRHRTVRLVLLLAGAMVALRALGAVGTPASNRGTILLVGGLFAAVCASRILARGAALEALRRTAAPWWLPPFGRLTGVGVLVLPVVGAAAVILGVDAGDAAQSTAVTLLYAVALAALTAALAPLAGATGAGTLGFLAAWLGSIPPSGIGGALARWPYLAVPAVTVWNLLPLEWRAARWLRAGGVGDAALFAVWIAGGVALAAWTAARAYRRETAPAGEA